MNKEKELANLGREQDSNTQQTGSEQAQPQESMNREVEPMLQDEQMGEDAAAEQQRKEALTERD
jgi:hypothetical protein